MKSVKKRRIWQNVLGTLFYHKCFASRSFLQGISLTKNYKSVWIFDGRRILFLLRERGCDVFSFDESCYLCLVYNYFPKWNNEVDPNALIPSLIPKQIFKPCTFTLVFAWNQSQLSFPTRCPCCKLKVRGRHGWDAVKVEIIVCNDIDIYFEIVKLLWNRLLLK